MVTLLARRKSNHREHFSMRLFPCFFSAFTLNNEQFPDCGKHLQTHSTLVGPQNKSKCPIQRMCRNILVEIYLAQLTNAYTKKRALRRSTNCVSIWRNAEKMGTCRATRNLVDALWGVLRCLWSKWFIYCSFSCQNSCPSWGFWHSLDRTQWAAMSHMSPQISPMHALLALERA